MSENKIPRTYRLNARLLRALKKKASEEKKTKTRIIEETLEKNLLESGHLKKRVF